MSESVLIRAVFTAALGFTEFVRETFHRKEMAVPVS